MSRGWRFTNVCDGDEGLDVRDDGARGVAAPLKTTIAVKENTEKKTMKEVTHWGHAIFFKEKCQLGGTPGR